MPRGSWSNVLKVSGLITAAGLLLWLLIADLSTWSKWYEDDASDRSSQYAEYADKYIADRCIALAAQDQSDCEYKAKQASRENQRIEQDLAAQKVTAWWTTIMGAAALIGMGLSAVGIILVWTTFYETRKANEIAQQSHIAQTRPWLIVEKLEIEWRYHIDDGNLEVFGDVWFVVKNTGRSAANNIWTRSAVGEPIGIWGKMWAEDESPLGPECLPPEGTRLVSEPFHVSMPWKNEGNLLGPQMACIQITYAGGGANGFVTECIWTISNWHDKADFGWIDADFRGYEGESISLNAYGHFGYFRTVT